jgi:phage gp36-like protein
VTIAASPSGGSGGGILVGSRARYTIGDTPSASYLFAQDVITFALPARVAADIGLDIVQAHCVAASSEFNSYAIKRYRLPIQAWGQDIVQKLAFRAAYSAMRQRGFNYEENMALTDGYKDAERWMENVRDYKINPDVTESTPIVNTPQVVSDPLRGW